MKKVVLPIAILGVSIGLAVLLVRSPKRIEEATLEVVPISVRVMPARKEATGLTVQSQGKVQAAQAVNLSAPVAGIVSWLAPQLQAGGYVAAGDTLVELDAGDYETALTRARAGLQQAEAEAALAAADLTRLEDLANRRLISQSELQSAQRSDAVTRARLMDAQAALRQAEMDLERTRIRAPFNAVVERRDVELGQYINRAQAVAVLYGADTVEVRVPLAIRQLGFLDLPADLRGELSPDRAPSVRLTGQWGGAEHAWWGRLVRLEAAIDDTSNSVQSIIRVDQPTPAADRGEGESVPLPIGLFVQAEIEGRQVGDVYALPRSVIRNNNQVLVVDAENKLYYRDVEIYRLEADRVLVSAGLSEGELICTSPIQAVYDGMAVQPVLEAI